MNTFNRMRSAIRRKSNNKRRDTQLKLYKAMAVSTLTYGSEIWTTTKKKGTEIETAEIKFLRSVAGHTKKGQLKR
jgi:hypothetical protein